MFALCNRGRLDSLDKARAHWAAGNTTAAYDCYQKAVDISPATAKRLIDVGHSTSTCS